MKKIIKKVLIIAAVLLALFVAWCIYGTIKYNGNGIEYVVRDAKEKKIDEYTISTMKKAGSVKYGYAKYTFSELSDDSYKSIKNAIKNAKELRKEKGYQFVYVKMNGSKGLIIRDNIMYGSNLKFFLNAGKESTSIPIADYISGAVDHRTYWSLEKSKGKSTKGINGLPTK